jgi:hypothetical protein
VLLPEPDVLEVLPPRPEEPPLNEVPPGPERLPLEVALGLVSGELRIPPEELEPLSGATLGVRFRSEPLAPKSRGVGLDWKAAPLPRRLTGKSELVSWDQPCQPAGPPHPNPRRASNPHRYQPAPFHPDSDQQ